MQPMFDIRKALSDAENIAKRKSVIFTPLEKTANSNLRERSEVL